MQVSPLAGGSSLILTNAKVQKITDINLLKSEKNVRFFIKCCNYGKKWNRLFFVINNFSIFALQNAGIFLLQP